ncbi:MAG TPA: phenylalanine--tRNA ligase subunit beta [Candidatus Binatia bacterium]
MKFTLNWLKEFVDFTGAPQELAKLLTMAGLEVESLSAMREPEANREDWLFEVSVTPNRGDCLGLAGIAREVSALSGAKLKATPLSAAKKDPSINKRIALEIEDPKLCPRYSARIVDGVRIRISPPWLRYRLETCGIRAINHIVDITNYVMLETGQPLHAFDLDRLPAKSIVVRPARETKNFTTLDGVERELVHEDLLVCAGDVPVALAGVMGGADSEVRDATRSILLESANFAPSAIRRTAKRLALHSEASHRFERGVDPEGTIRALDRAVGLIKEIGEGDAPSGAADRYPGRAKPLAIRLREGRIEKLLGVHIDLRQAERLLHALGLKSARQTKSRSLKVVTPSSRPDLTREADLIEELARLKGYDSIPTTLPLLRISDGKNNDERSSWERKLRGLLAGEGLTEVINLPFTSEPLNQCFTGLWEPAASAVAVLNPLTKENSEMRRSLIPALIDNMRLNLAQKARSFHAYQLGKSFCLTAAGVSAERQCLGGLLYGPRPHLGLRLSEEHSLIFPECKGLIESIVELFHLTDAVTWTPVAVKFLHPGKSASLRCAEGELGYLGEIHPDVAERLEIPAALAFELDLDKLLEYAPRRIVTHALPRFPAVERDLAIVVDRDFASQHVISWINSLGEPWIEDVEVFDQYLGAPIPEGKKSLAYRVSYRAEDKTLTDAEINELHQKLVQGLRNAFGVEQRA